MSRSLLCCMVLVWAISVSQAHAQGQATLPMDAVPEQANPMPEGRIRLVPETGGHAGKPLDVVFTPDGKRLISIGADRTVQVWDLATYERLREFHLPLGVNGNSAFLSIGKPLVVDRQGEHVAFCMRAGDARSLQRVHWSYNGGYFEKSTDLAWTQHADSGKFSFAENRRTDELVELIDKSRNVSVILYGNRGTIKRGKGDFLPWHPGTWDNDTTFICALKTGQAQVLHRAGPRDFTPDGASLVVAEGTSLHVVDIATDKPRQTALKVASKNILHITFSPDGKTLAALAQDGKVYLLDGATLKPRRTPASVPHATNITWADDHTLILRCSAKEKSLVVLNADTSKEKNAYAFADIWQKLPKDMDTTVPPTISVEAVADTTQAFIGTRYRNPYGAWPRGGFLFDWATGTAGKAFSQHIYLEGHDPAIAPGLGVAALGAGDGNAILLWDPKEGKALMNGKSKRTLRAPAQGAVADYSSIRWFTDETVAWTRIGGGPKELQLDTLTMRSVSDGKRQEANKKLAAATRGNTPLDKDWVNRQMYDRGILRKSGQLALVARAWDNWEIRGGDQIATIKFPAMGWNTTFVADTRVIFNGFGGAYVYVYDSATGKRLFGRRVTYSDISSLAVSPNRRYVVIGSLDQTLTIFNPATGKVLLTIFPAAADWIAWTPEGYYAGTPGGERLVGWHVENGPDKLANFYPADRFHERFFRPDVIKLILKTGSVAEALKVANAALPPDLRPKTNAVVDVAKLLPPRTTLNLLSASDKGVVRLTTDVVAEPGGDGVGSLRLMVDGRPVSAKGFVKEFDKPQAKITHKWPDLQLPPGKHQVVVLARSADSSSASNVLSIDTRPAKDRPTLHVLAIGVSKYKDKGLDLACAANDARLIAQTFSQCKGPIFGDVRTTVLADDKATRAALIDAIVRLRTGPVNKVKDGDLVVLFFAGHGAKEKEEFYLLTHDAVLDSLATTALAGAKLQEELKALPCQVLLMLDACQSAAYGAKGKLAQKDLPPATDLATRKMTEDEVAVAVMCAAMGNEKAIERDQNGLFTKAIAAALTAKGGVPCNPVNHKQYLHHLQSYVFDRVTAESDDRQHPFLHLPWVVESFALRQIPE